MNELEARIDEMDRFADMAQKIARDTSLKNGDAQFIQLLIYCMERTTKLISDSVKETLTKSDYDPT